VTLCCVGEPLSHYQYLIIMDSLNTPRLSLKRKRVQSPQSPTLPPKETPTATAATSVDRDTDDFLKWCINRIFTSTKVIDEQQAKLAKLQQQLDDNEFPQWVRNKFKNLCAEALIAQCRFVTNEAIASCIKKIDNAKSTINQARVDFADFVKVLEGNDDTKPVVKNVQKFFKESLATRLAGLTAKKLMKEKKQQKKPKPKPKGSGNANARRRARNRS